jgi:hypothetical protein
MQEIVVNGGKKKAAEIGETRKQANSTPKPINTYLKQSWERPLRK